MMQVDSGIQPSSTVSVIYSLKCKVQANRLTDELKLKLNVNHHRLRLDPPLALVANKLWLTY